jgi:ssDNA-binding Zn-finger/Zn-ribbon topoisomerase 1
MSNRLTCCPKCGSTGEVQYLAWQPWDGYVSFETGETTTGMANDTGIKEPKTGECVKCGHKIKLKKVRPQ